MKKLLFLFLIILGSCTSSLKVTNVNFNDPYVQYNKVKLKVNIGALENITLRGYIYISRDTLFCFKFYGPFSYALLSGYYEKKFLVYDYYNKVLHEDIMRQITDKTGIVFNKKSLEHFLFGNAVGLKEELLILNKNIISCKLSEGKQRKKVFIENKMRNNHLYIEFSYKNNIPKSIEVSFQDSDQKWNMRMDILQISNDKRNCTFNY